MKVTLVLLMVCFSLSSLAAKIECNHGEYSGAGFDQNVHVYDLSKIANGSAFISERLALFTFVAVKDGKGLSLKIIDNSSGIETTSDGRDLRMIKANNAAVAVLSCTK